MDQTSYRYNLEYRASVRARMLELAKQLLSGDLGVVAARALVPFSDGVEPEIGTILNVLSALILRQTPSLQQPVAEVILLTV
jgi:hypothetical protein